MRIYVAISIGFSLIFSCSAADDDQSSPSAEDVAMSFLQQRIESSLKDAYCSNHSSMDEFPDDPFTTDDARKHGAIVLHIFCAIYFFTLLAVVCNDYFLPSVECICMDLRIPKDVAAASFMATATTMPEFFTNVISTFITESDIGIGTIIGSLMFNTLGVAAVASFAAPKPVQLDWWPITRDCILYSCNVIALMTFTWDNQITLTETIIMVCMFFTYFLIIVQNKRVMPTVKWFLEEYMSCCRVRNYELPTSFIEKKLGEKAIAKNTNETKMATTKEKPLKKSTSRSSINNAPIFMIYAREKEIDETSGKKVRKSLWRIPCADRLKTIWWFYTWPIKLILTMTIPNPKTFRKLYPLTFIMCIIWIGINAYMIVWMMATIGFTFSVPDALMGLTFLAAGGCMPEGISSVLSIRKGDSGVGVSNSLGSNSMSILMSLGIPWLIKNIIHRNDPDKSSIIIASYGIQYTIPLLLIAVVSLYLVLTLSGYRLKKSAGVSLSLSYLLLITLAILLELNLLFPGFNCSL